MNSEDENPAAAPFSPPRLLPDRPFPAYAYQPGRTPHPTRDPEGHSYGAETRTPDPPDPQHWRACGDYLYGIDLFNHGFYWEAHEAWEGLWVACGRVGPTATFLQALINLAAARFKARWGSARGTAANAATALRLLQSFAAQTGRHGGQFMGLDVGVLADLAIGLSKPHQAALPDQSGNARLDLDMILLPD